MKIELELTKVEVEKLEQMLYEWDTGPEGEGWYSETLISLQNKVIVEVEKKRKLS